MRGKENSERRYGVGKMRERYIQARRHAGEQGRGEGEIYADAPTCRGEDRDK